MRIDPLHRTPQPTFKSQPWRIQKIWVVFYECVIKEFASCILFAWNRVVYRQHEFGLNPPKVEVIGEKAKIILVIHGAAGHKSCFRQLAEKFAEAGIKNVYTVSITQTDEDPVPVNELKTRIQKIRKKYVPKKCKEIEYCIIGHSLGALVASKYIWRFDHKDNVSLMISISGRLEYIPSKTSHQWFCEDVVPEIDRTAIAMKDDPDKTNLFTIWGDQDPFVPKESAHNPGHKKYTVKGSGHAGIVYDSSTHKKIISWVRRWLNQ